MTLLFEGNRPALSNFRLRQHYHELVKLGAITEVTQEQAPGKVITASTIYAVQTIAELSAGQRQLLSTLLTAGDLPPTADHQPHPHLPSAYWDFYVVPRLGTRSPWCDKATDIAQICGLTPVSSIERGIWYRVALASTPTEKKRISDYFHDPLTESVLTQYDQLLHLWHTHNPKPLTVVDVQQQGIHALRQINHTLNLALSEAELNYLYQLFYQQLKRNPTDVELMMFAQMNSEHCRHKIFNAKWQINEADKKHSLFALIKQTYQQAPHTALVAYHDNAAVILGSPTSRLHVDALSKKYITTPATSTPLVFKVETHNHPTAIAPHPGAATGSGGEIRDEAATGRGAHSKMGMCGFAVSHLRLPELPQAWEQHSAPLASPAASALHIMLQAPLGAAAFNNEFGRPNLCGFFRTMEILPAHDQTATRWGYYKPIMIAGGVGHIQPLHQHKQSLHEGDLLIVLGGPAMAIGLGGGAASSKTANDPEATLDFASVQRANPEMQRRAQEVINACCALGENNPIVSIHDVGAGGLSNALPELVHDNHHGAHCELRHIINHEPGMSPLALWCNEAQERFVLAIAPAQLDILNAIAKRERCPLAVVGRVTQDDQQRFIVSDSHFQNDAVNLPLAALLEKMPALECEDHTQPVNLATVDLKAIDISEAIERVLQFPCVADKSFLITIGDRSVGGLVARDPMVGPWQVPVADVAVTASDFVGYAGEAMAVGERPAIALIDSACAARIALGEAITNIMASHIECMSDIALSANWMAAADYPGEGAKLYAAVHALSSVCQAVGLSIPVGKDSLSMQMQWQSAQATQTVVSPCSLVVTAASRVTDIRKTLTPQLQLDNGETVLLLIDLGQAANRLGASVLSQVYNGLQGEVPDLATPELLVQFSQALHLLKQQDRVLAYHDRSDGGLLATLCEMMFASHCGLHIDLDQLGDKPVASLFSEELGVVIQIRTKDLNRINAILQQYQLEAHSHVIGHIQTEDQLSIYHQQRLLYQQPRIYLHRLWSKTSYHLQALRDNPDSAQQQYDAIVQKDDPGLQQTHLTFNWGKQTTPRINVGSKPKMAILREQGVNGHHEMAAAFMQAGFDCVDVHMSDLLADSISLQSFKGLAAPGGFSYGDVLGAGTGWANSILLHENLREQFSAFFNRTDTVTFGACNGCQMLSQLKSIIPGAEHWPSFHRNTSEQYEARLVMVEILQSSSILFKDMHGSRLPIVVSHAEGHAAFQRPKDLTTLQHNQQTVMHYLDASGNPTELYPYNPNGSPCGINGFTNSDGRVTIIMPHPERIFRSVQCSWHPKQWPAHSPWFKLFTNARKFVDAA